MATNSKPKYAYTIILSRGFPMDTPHINKYGEEGWLLTGVTVTTELATSTEHDPYPVEVFWYYFVREEETRPTGK